MTGILPRRRNSQVRDRGGNGGGNHQPDMHRRAPLSLEDAAENKCAKQRLGVGEACPGAVGQGRARAKCSSLAERTFWAGCATGLEAAAIREGAQTDRLRRSASRERVSIPVLIEYRLPISKRHAGECRPRHRIDPMRRSIYAGAAYWDNTVWAGKFKDLQTSKTFTSKNCDNFRYALSRIRGVSHIERTRRNGTLGMDEFMNSDEPRATVGSGVDHGDAVDLCVGRDCVWSLDGPGLGRYRSRSNRR